MSDLSKLDISRYFYDTVPFYFVLLFLPRSSLVVIPA